MNPRRSHEYFVRTRLVAGPDILNGPYRSLVLATAAAREERRVPNVERVEVEKVERIRTVVSKWLPMLKDRRADRRMLIPPGETDRRLAS